MLVLSRKADQTIVIRDTAIEGEPVILTIKTVSVRGDKVRLGFEADPRYSIRRTEIDGEQWGGSPAVRRRRLTGGSGEMVAIPQNGDR